MKKCPPGEYYCHDMKKCRKIPRGYHLGARGWLEKDDLNGKKNGNGNGNGNGNNGGNGHSSGGNGNGGNGGGNGGVSEEILKIEDYNDKVQFRDFISFDVIKPKPKSTIAIFGMGGIGLSALMAARLFDCIKINFLVKAFFS